jgi:hypothetical protein
VNGTVVPAKGSGGSGVTEEGERHRVGRLRLDWAVLAELQLSRFGNFQRKGVGLPW